MEVLIIGIIIFFAIHLVPSFVITRQKLISRLGEGPYKGLYSLIALTGLVLIIYGKGNAEFIAIWNPVSWGRNIVFITMLVSVYLLVAADSKSNIKRFIRHPMLAGVMLWSAVHLLANGDLASILLFGSFFTYSLIAMVSANLRGAAKQVELVPIKYDIMVIVASFVVYLVFVKYLHPLLIGVTLI